MADWVKWLLLGILSVLFGIFALNHAVLASLGITLSVGVLFLISGIVQAIAGFGDDGMWNKFLSIGLGVLMAILGFSFLSNPLSGTVTLATLVTIFILVSGVFRLLFAFEMRGTGYFMMMLISGLLSVGLAIYIFMNPALTVAVLGILMGVELLFNGIGLMVLALFMRGNKDA